MSRETFRIAGSDEVTSDVDVYAKSWIDYGNCAMAFFPGYVASAYDPGVTLDKRRFFKNHNGDEVYAVEDTIKLSTEAIDLLVKMALEFA
jgi:hypothetical protein